MPVPTILLVNGLGDQLIALPTIRALAALCGEPLQLLLGEGLRSFFYRDVALRGGEGKRVWWASRDALKLDVERSAAAAEPTDLFVSLCTWPDETILAPADWRFALRGNGAGTAPPSV